MGRLTRTQSIIGKMDDLALNMLEGVNTSKKGDTPQEVDLTNKLDVFEKVAKWIAVKNKLEADEDDGIASYKARIYGEGPERGGPSAKSRKAENGGDRLAQLKSRIPTADDGDDDSDSDAVVGADSAAA